MKDEWGPGTGIIIVLLMLIAGKLGVFAGWSDPANWIWTAILIIGFLIVALVYASVRWVYETCGVLWAGIPERVRFFGEMIFLVTWLGYAWVAALAKEQDRLKRRIEELERRR